MEWMLVIWSDCEPRFIPDLGAIKQSKVCCCCCCCRPAMQAVMYPAGHCLCSSYGNGGCIWCTEPCCTLRRCAASTTFLACVLTAACMSLASVISMQWAKPSPASIRKECILCRWWTGDTCALASVNPHSCMMQITSLGARSCSTRRAPLLTTMPCPCVLSHNAAPHALISTLEVWQTLQQFVHGQDCNFVENMQHRQARQARLNPYCGHSAGSSAWLHHPAVGCRRARMSRHA